jgi:molybdenum cofactor guanylyltransferase
VNESYSTRIGNGKEFSIRIHRPLQQSWQPDKVNAMTHDLEPNPRKEKHPCSGVILAGGLNIRFKRNNKALATIGKGNILENVLRVFRALFDEIILVTNTPLVYASWDVSIVTDIYPVRSPLTGIYSGLLYAANPHIFVAACDAPFLQKELVLTVLDNIDRHADIFVPETGKGMEPLCAAYSKKCLPHIERVLLNQLEVDSNAGNPMERILKQSLKVRSFFEQVRVKTIDEAQLRAKDTNLISFFNVNTPDDLAKALEMVPENPREWK